MPPYELRSRSTRATNMVESHAYYFCRQAMTLSRLSALQTAAMYCDLAAYLFLQMLHVFVSVCVCLCVCMLVTPVCCAKTAEPIEKPFWG